MSSAPRSATARDVRDGTPDVAPGDVLLVCSDGLHGVVSDDRILALVEEPPAPDAAADALIVAADSYTLSGIIH